MGESIMNAQRNTVLNKTLLFLTLAIFAAILLSPLVSIADQTNALYVGSKVCKTCHPEEYANFIRYAKKSRSYESIEKMKKGLNQDDLKKCYGCHTTGYGKPGGFISVEKTPELKNDGCEVCHGPGSKHVKNGDITAIRRHLTRDVCEACHTSERVRAFRYKPIIHGGGH